MASVATYIDFKLHKFFKILNFPSSPLFNLFIEEATGLKGPFPYKRQLEFDIKGLPGLLAFRKPSGYWTSQLKSILQCKDQIKFKRKEVNDRSTSTFTTDTITIIDPVSDPTTQTLSITNQQHQRLKHNPNTISDPSSLHDHVITSDQTPSTTLVLSTKTSNLGVKDIKKQEKSHTSKVYLLTFITIHCSHNVSLIIKVSVNDINLAFGLTGNTYLDYRPYPL
jgi:hypothetical protein